MINIIAPRETGYFDSEPGCITEYNYWEQIRMAYDVDQLILIPDKFGSVAEALSSVSGTRVFLEQAHRAKEPLYLKDFYHPKDGVYIFGKAGSNNVSLVKNDFLVSVEQPNGKGDMFALTMASIVLRDRFLKHGNR